MLNRDSKRMRSLSLVLIAVLTLGVTLCVSTSGCKSAEQVNEMDDAHFDAYANTITGRAALGAALAHEEFDVPLADLGVLADAIEQVALTGDLAMGIAPAVAVLVEEETEKKWVGLLAAQVLSEVDVQLFDAGVFGEGMDLVRAQKLTQAVADGVRRIAEPPE